MRNYRIYERYQKSLYTYEQYKTTLLTKNYDNSKRYLNPQIEELKKISSEPVYWKYFPNEESRKYFEQFVRIYDALKMNKKNSNNYEKWLNLLINLDSKTIKYIINKDKKTEYSINIIRILIILEDKNCLTELYNKNNDIINNQIIFENKIYTPVAFAIELSNIDMVKFLFDLGADPFIHGPLNKEKNEVAFNSLVNSKDFLKELGAAIELSLENNLKKTVAMESEMITRDKVKEALEKYLRFKQSQIPEQSDYDLVGQYKIAKLKSFLENNEEDILKKEKENQELLLLNPINPSKETEINENCITETELYNFKPIKPKKEKEPKTLQKEIGYWLNKIETPKQDIQDLFKGKPLYKIASTTQYPFFAAFTKKLIETLNSSTKILKKLQDKLYNLKFIESNSTDEFGIKNIKNSNNDYWKIKFAKTDDEIIADKVTKYKDFVVISFNKVLNHKDQTNLPIQTEKAEEMKSLGELNFDNYGFLNVED